MADKSAAIASSENLEIPAKKLLSFPTKMEPESKLDSESKVLSSEAFSLEKSECSNTEVANSFNYSFQMKINSFQELKLNSELFKSLQSNGIQIPTELQSKILSPLTKGRSMLIESPRASGKLTSLSIGLLHRANLSRVTLQALIITDLTDACSKLELALSILSEDAISIKLDDLDDVAAGEIAEHHFIMGSEGKASLLCDIIESIKSRVVLYLYNVNLESGLLIRKIVENKFKFFQIVIMRSSEVLSSYELISQLLDANTVYFASATLANHSERIINILESKQTDKPTVNNNNQEELDEIIESPITEICQRLESGEKLLRIFEKYNLPPDVLPGFYIFVLHYLLRGVSVVQTGYKPTERVNLLSIIAKEFNSHLTIPVRVVVCHDGRELAESILTNDNQVFQLKNGQNLSDIPPDKTIVVASSTKTLSVLTSFPKLFQGTGRLILFLNTQVEKFREISRLFPDGLLFLAMLKCRVETVEKEVKLPFIHVSRRESNLSVSAFQGATVSPGELSCIELVPKNIPDIPIQSKPILNQPQNHFPDLEETDRVVLPNIVSFQLLETIAAKHGINPQRILPFYQELFSFAIRGDNILLIGFAPKDFTPILNLIMLEKASSGTAPGCQVVLFAPHLESPLSEYPNCVQLIPSNEENILNISSIVRVDSVSDVIRMYAEQTDKFRTFKKLVVLIGVSFDECVELIAERMHCQFLFVFSDFPSDEFFQDFPLVFVRFLNVNGSVRIESVGKEVAYETPDDFLPEVTENSGPSTQNDTDPTLPLILEIEERYQTETSLNPTFFHTVLTHVFNGDNIVITNFYQDIVTTLVTILYQEYSIGIPGGGHTLVCLGSKISELLLPTFKCLSNLWLADNVSVLSLPSKQEETFFLTIAKMLHILNNEFDFLVKQNWFIMLIGLSHQETQNCIPFIPLSNQYLFILSIEHPQFKKFMSAPYLIINSSKRKPLTTEWVHKGKMKSFKAEYKQTEDAPLNSTDSKESNEFESILRDVASSLLNSGKHILIQTDETNILFEYILYNVDKGKTCIQAIYTTPTIISSVKLFARLNKYLRLKKENGVKAFLYSKGGLDQLSAFLANTGFHLLITTNDILPGILKQPGIMGGCCLVVFDGLRGGKLVDQSERTLPQLINQSIPRRIQCVLQTGVNEKVSNLIRQLRIPIYHVKQARSSTEKICFRINCYF